MSGEVKMVGMEVNWYRIIASCGASIDDQLITSCGVISILNTTGYLYGCLSTG